MTPEITQLRNELVINEKLLKDALNAHYNLKGKIAPYWSRKFIVEHVTYVNDTSPYEISGRIIGKNGKPGKRKGYQFAPFKFEDSES